MVEYLAEFLFAKVAAIFLAKKAKRGRQRGRDGGGGNHVKDRRSIFFATLVGKFPFRGKTLEREREFDLRLDLENCFNCDQKVPF